MTSAETTALVLVLLVGVLATTEKGRAFLKEWFGSWLKFVLLGIPAILIAATVLSECSKVTSPSDYMEPTRR